ncbi:hypothetical protein [Thiohalorhabdus sp.]|uniref:hypothetical protein n=1 Tax=Thiohalorhabdus sp. TaxID=3094134 RepID=UPI002FC3012B
MGNGYSIQALGHHDEVEGFACGTRELNKFIKRKALTDQDLSVSKTYVAALPDNRVIGYITITLAQILTSQIPETLQGDLPTRYPLSAQRLARWAVDQNWQGYKVGKGLLRYAFLQMLEVADKAGTAFVIVDAKDDELKSKYQNELGFVPLGEESYTLILPISTLRSAYQHLG